MRKNSEVSDVLNEMISTGKIDFDRIGEIINDEIYKKAGINREDLKQISNPLNSKYSHYIQKLKASKVHMSIRKCYRFFKNKNSRNENYNIKNKMAKYISHFEILNKETSQFGNLVSQQKLP